MNEKYQLLKYIGPINLHQNFLLIQLLLKRKHNLQLYVINHLKIILGSNVYKVYYYLPDWIEGSHVCNTFGCQCRDHHRKLQTPQITNIAKDPHEIFPLSPPSKEYQEVLEAVAMASQEHKQTLTPVPNQMADMGFSRLRPWLQPCCKLPLCMCEDDPDNALNYRAPWEKQTRIMH